MNKVIEVKNEDACDPESWMTSFGGDGYTYYHFVPTLKKQKRISKRQAIRLAKQESELELAKQIKKLSKTLSYRGIAERLGISKAKVQRILPSKK